ncbi:hypothetical protein BDN70DRAFT_921181 [Pholiota conissans]|uniref:Uncharacterized protein n=1 Tax=Pholiota conissans TaxID=109636 RepID=A0A9P5Z3C3_9AGAR|nr:hypothetical protein BDN70DRAFT_921181 [Pholiota conissans]
MGWAIHFGIRVPLPEGFPGCVLTGRSPFLAAMWGAPLVTDTCIFALTLWRTLRYKKAHGFSSTIQVILRDGTIYFFAIFSVNLMNCLIYLLVVEDLKAMGASFSQIMTSILISRLQLNLRNSQNEGSNINLPSGQRTLRLSFVKNAPNTSTFFTIGNLGEDMEGSFLDTITERDEVVGTELNPTTYGQRKRRIELNLNA